MYEREVIVTTKHGLMPSFVAAPDGPGAWPAIIFYMDAPGIREELRNMARRIAKQGYFCILPDMYYRNGTLRFDLPRRDDAMSGVIRAAMNSLTNALVVDDTAALLAYIDAQENALAGPVGCVGHCMSGQYITTVAARFPHRIASAGSLYGVGIVTERDDSPHKLVGQIRGELYYGFAERDAAVKDHEIPTLAAALAEAGVAHEIEQIPGTLHGYCFAERPAYNPLASEISWGKLFALWERTLKPRGRVAMDSLLVPTAGDEGENEQ